MCEEQDTEHWITRPVSIPTRSSLSLSGLKSIQVPVPVCYGMGGDVGEKYRNAW